MALRRQARPLATAGARARLRGCRRFARKANRYQVTAAAGDDVWDSHQTIELARTRPMTTTAPAGDSTTRHTRTILQARRSLLVRLNGNTRCGARRSAAGNSAAGNSTAGAATVHVDKSDRKNQAAKVGWTVLRFYKVMGMGMFALETQSQTGCS